eukprot:gene3915-13986_t
MPGGLDFTTEGETPLSLDYLMDASQSTPSNSSNCSRSGSVVEDMDIEDDLIFVGLFPMLSPERNTNSTYDPLLSSSSMPPISSIKIPSNCSDPPDSVRPIQKVEPAKCVYRTISRSVTGLLRGAVVPGDEHKRISFTANCRNSDSPKPLIQRVQEGLRPEVPLYLRA